MRNIVIPRKDLVPWSSDTSKHSAAFKLFHYPFNFRISRLHLTDPQYVELFGRMTTGDLESDRVMALEEVPIIRTIAQMVDFHRRGIGFRLQDPKDGVRIYEYVYEHLQDWRQTIDSSPLLRSAPIEDLRAFDEFAKEVYLLARGYISYRPAEGSLSNFFEQLAASRGTLGRRAIDIEAERNEQAVRESTHHEQAGAMARILRERQKTFRN